MSFCRNRFVGAAKGEVVETRRRVSGGGAAKPPAWGEFESGTSGWLRRQPGKMPKMTYSEVRPHPTMRERRASAILAEDGPSLSLGMGTVRQSFLVRMGGRRGCGGFGKVAM